MATSRQSPRKLHPQVVWLLDTNTISELARPQPAPAVVERFTRLQHEIGLPSPVWHELQFGVLRMADGRRKELLRQFVQQVGSSLPKLAYDEDAARIHAELRADAEACGRVLPTLDAQIAAIAIAHGCILVTRNSKDFAELPGLRQIDWFVA